MTRYFGMEALQVPFGASTDFVSPAAVGYSYPELTDLHNYDFPFRATSLTAST